MVSLADWELLTAEELLLLTPETRLLKLEASLRALHDKAMATDTFDIAAELRGFVLGMTGAALRW